MQLPVVKAPIPVLPVPKPPGIVAGVVGKAKKIFMGGGGKEAGLGAPQAEVKPAVAEAPKVPEPTVSQKIAVEKARAEIADNPAANPQEGLEAIATAPQASPAQTEQPGGLSDAERIALQERIQKDPDFQTLQGRRQELVNQYIQELQHKTPVDSNEYAMHESAAIAQAEARAADELVAQHPAKAAEWAKVSSVFKDALDRRTQSQQTAATAPSEAPPSQGYKEYLDQTIRKLGADVAAAGQPSYGEWLTQEVQSLGEQQVPQAPVAQPEAVAPEALVPPVDSIVAQNIRIDMQRDLPFQEMRESVQATIARRLRGDAATPEQRAAIEAEVRASGYDSYVAGLDKNGLNKAKDYTLVDRDMKAALKRKALRDINKMRKAQGETVIEAPAPSLGEQLQALGVAEEQANDPKFQAIYERRLAQAEEAAAQGRRRTTVNVRNVVYDATSEFNARAQEDIFASSGPVVEPASAQQAATGTPKESADQAQALWGYLRQDLESAAGTSSAGANEVEEPGKNGKAAGITTEAAKDQTGQAEAAAKPAEAGNAPETPEQKIERLEEKIKTLEERQSAGNDFFAVLTQNPEALAALLKLLSQEKAPEEKDVADLITRLITALLGYAISSGIGSAQAGMNGRG